MIQRTATYQGIVKPAADRGLAAIGVLLLSPVLVAIAIAVRISSRGPAFFRQERLGRHGEPFQLIKFRTMSVGSEHMAGGIRTSSDDPRITRLGHSLRSSSLDELPQLINVLKGEMSIIGPRPPVTYHPYDGFGDYPRWAKPRFDVLPGITGLSQVKLRNREPWDQRLLIDVEYVSRMSFMLDLKIFFATLLQVTRRSSIYAPTERTGRISE